jgi:ParB-like chromosome segregation protein Spo0J
VRSEDGTTVTVRNGQRRTLGAREVGLTSVPVYVLPANACDETAEAVERIVHQIVTNDQKADLTDAQRARGIQQMIDAGLSATKVAKIIRTKGSRTSAALADGCLTVCACSTPNERTRTRTWSSAGTASAWPRPLRPRIS